MRYSSSPVQHISIHAPTNGATPYKKNAHCSAFISIHAPTNGATCREIPYCGCYCYFNPRSDERSDPVGQDFAVAIIYFNPRSDERSDL